MKYLYKYPQREYPVPGPDRDEPAADRGKSSSTSCSTPASSTTIGTSTCSWSTRRRARKTFSSASPCTIADPKRPGFASCRRCGSATPGRGATTSPSRRCAKSGRASSRPRTTSSATTGCSCDGAPELLFTENESNAQRLWSQPNPSPYVKDAFHDYVISGRGEAVNPAKVGHQGRRPLRARRARRRQPDRPPASDGRPGRQTPLAVSTRRSRAGSPTPTSSTSGSRRSR